MHAHAGTHARTHTHNRCFCCIIIIIITPLTILEEDADGVAGVGLGDVADHGVSDAEGNGVNLVVLVGGRGQLGWKEAMYTGPKSFIRQDRPNSRRISKHPFLPSAKHSSGAV